MPAASAKDGRAPCRVLGVDPGLLRTGYAVIDWSPPRGARVVEAGVIRLTARASVAHRLNELHEDLSGVVRDHRPDRMVVEKVFARPAHPATSILMGHARGVVLLVAAREGLGLDEITATAVKKAVTGNGHASKQSIQRAVTAQCRLARPPRPADVADAIAIALSGARRMAP